MRKGQRNKDADIDLGLAVIEGMIVEGKISPPVTQEVIAAACCVSHAAIQLIEAKGIRRARMKLGYFDKELGDQLREALAAVAARRDFHKIGIIDNWRA